MNEKYVRNVIRASFRKVDDDVLEIRRGSSDVAVRLMSWVMLSLIFSYWTLASPGIGPTGFRENVDDYIETIQNTFNPDPIVKPYYNSVMTMREEIIAEGRVPLSDYRTYEEFKQDFLEFHTEIFWDGFTYLIFTFLFLLGITFPRSAPLRIDRRRKLIYTRNWRRDFIIHGNHPEDLFDESCWDILFPAGKKKWQMPMLILNHYSTIDRYEQRPPKPPLLRRKHRPFDVGIFPPKDGEVQISILIQFLEDFFNYRNTSYLDEIGKRYKVRRPLQLLLNLTCWPWSGRLNEAKTEAGIKQQLTLWQKEQRILSGEESE